MSSDNNKADNMMITPCAYCGIPEADEIKLKECDDCDLVRYCSDACQENHKPQHEEACKKRAAELRDELLFKQPESTNLGDCPICMLPLPFDYSKSSLYSCCSKVICIGCDHANQIREIEGRLLLLLCPFCREPTPDTAEDCTKLMMKRVEANDPVALCQEGLSQYSKGDYLSAFEYYTKAAELGDAEAHYQLSHMYRDGVGVEEDKENEMHQLEEAAIGGHPDARYNLGIGEWNNGKTERAVKHFIIAAAQGEDYSIKMLMEEFKSGVVSKDDLAAALRAQQAAVDATKSPQREAAEEYFPNRQAFERY